MDITQDLDGRTPVEFLAGALASCVEQTNQALVERDEAIEEVNEDLRTLGGAVVDILDRLARIEASLARLERRPVEA